MAPVKESHAAIRIDTAINKSVDIKILYPKITTFEVIEKRHRLCCLPSISSFTQNQNMQKYTYLYLPVWLTFIVLIGIFVGAMVWLYHDNQTNIMIELLD
jgi:hypothetical protein